jgi:hypothetical protein
LGGRLHLEIFALASGGEVFIAALWGPLLADIVAKVFWGV